MYLVIPGNIISYSVVYFSNKDKPVILILLPFYGYETDILGDITVKIKIEPRVFHSYTNNTVCLVLFLRATITRIRQLKTSGWEEEAI